MNEILERVYVYFPNLKTHVGLFFTILNILLECSTKYCRIPKTIVGKFLIWAEFSKSVVKTISKRVCSHINKQKKDYNLFCLRNGISIFLAIIFGSVGLIGTAAKMLLIYGDTSMSKRLLWGGLVIILSAGTGLFPYIIAAPRKSRKTLEIARASVTYDRYATNI